MTTSTEILLQQLKTKEITIFGVGFVAEMFFRALEFHHAEEGLRFCVVTHALRGQMFHGRPVLNLEEAPVTENMLLCVAVHSSAEESLRASLRPYEAQIIWVYPYLFELLYGKPLSCEWGMPLKNLLGQQNREEYWLAVRYAAIRDYLSQKQEYQKTRSIYIKAISLHCGKETARRRASRMEALALSMKKEGFRDNCPVQIDGSGRVIDGLHRIACAAYLQIETIPAVVYPVSPVFDMVLGEKTGCLRMFSGGLAFRRMNCSSSGTRSRNCS